MSLSNFKKHIGFGIAGNFALHLEQAGELEDFKDVETEDENGPKGKVGNKAIYYLNTSFLA